MKNRYKVINGYLGFTGLIIGMNTIGYIKELKVRLLEDNGNYKKHTIVYLPYAVGE